MDTGRLIDRGQAHATFARELHARSFSFARQAVRWPAESAPQDDELLSALDRFSVTLVASRACLRSTTGQAATLFAANLLARMFVGVTLCIPRDIELLIDPPDGRYFGVGLAECALALMRSISPAGRFDVPVEMRGLEAGTAWMVLGGNAGVPETDDRVFVGGNGWEVAIGAESARDWQESDPRNPLGGLVSVAFGVMDLYKTFLRRVARPRFPARELDRNLAFDLRPIDRLAFNLLTYGPSPRSNNARLPDSIELGAMVVVSAGAIANAALYGLLSVPAISATGTVVEPKELDVPDLNRYVLMTAADLGVRKAERLAERVAPRVALSVEQALYQGSNARTRIAAASIALVGVDHPLSRTDIQRDRPRLIVNGATENASAYVSRHAADEPETPCLECFNEHAERAITSGAIPTLAPTSAVAGLFVAAEAIKSFVRELAPYRLNTQVAVNTLRADLDLHRRPSTPRANCACASGYRTVTAA